MPSTRHFCSPKMSALLGPKFHDGTKAAASVSIAAVNATAARGGRRGLESDEHAAFDELDGAVGGHHAALDVGDFDCAGGRARPAVQRGQESVAGLRGASGC